MAIAYDKTIDRHVPMGPSGERVIMSAASDLIPVDPSEEPTFSPFAYLHVADDGDVEVVTVSGETRAYPAGTFAPGVTHPLMITQVLSGTTAIVLAAIV